MLYIEHIEAGDNFIFRLTFEKIRRITVDCDGSIKQSVKLQARQEYTLGLACSFTITLTHEGMKMTASWPVYEFEDDQSYFESLPTHECHDPQERHEMRQQPGYIPETCRVMTKAEVAAVHEATSTAAAVVFAALVEVSTTDMREGVRIARAGFSQAPPRWMPRAANDVAPTQSRRAA